MSMTMWIWLMMPGCAILLIIMWLIFGKDKKTIPAITVSPPGGLDPLEMEYAQIATITDRGIFAMLMYWVSQGLVGIVDHGGHREGEAQQAGLDDADDRDNLDDGQADLHGPAEDRIGVRRIAELPEDAPEHAKFLFEGLFRRSDRVWLDKFPPEIGDHKGELRDLVGTRFTGKNAVVQNDDMYATIIAMLMMIVAIFVIDVTLDVGVLLPLFLGVALFCGLALLQNGALGFRSKYDRFEIAAGTIITLGVLAAHLALLGWHVAGALFLLVFAGCFLICIPCIMFMERRVNHRLYGQILGFRKFIEMAERDRLQRLASESPTYGMDILPYAMLFNMGTAWTSRFENLTILGAVETMEEMTKE